MGWVYEERGQPAPWGGGGGTHKKLTGDAQQILRVSIWVFWNGKSLHFPFQVLLRALQKEFTKNATTVTTPEFSLGVSLSLSHTHIGLT